MEQLDLGELRAIVESLAHSVHTLQEVVDRNYMKEHLREMLSTHYTIGDLVDVKKLDRGYVNVSYELETMQTGKKQRYFLRRYKRGIREEEVRFEHSIVKHLMKKQFPLSAGLIFRKDGATYVKETEEREGEVEEVYFAVFEFLKGEDKYTWDNPACSRKELADAARVLARYHDAVCDLRYEGRRYEAKIIDLLPTIGGNLMKYAKRTGNTKFDAYFLKHLDYTLHVIDGTQEQIDRKVYEQLPQLAVHADYHPGNLKFRKGTVVGLFDFDWSKIDVRCFDVALAMTYACTTWEGKDDGDLLLDRISLFLKSYQDEAFGLKDMGPLQKREIEFLPVMMKASNLYVLNWDVDDYYIKKPNPFEYLIYLQHNIRTMRWIENNWDNLKAVISSVTESHSYH
jgi:homoserine kinase type II